MQSVFCDSWTALDVTFLLEAPHDEGPYLLLFLCGEQHGGRDKPSSMSAERAFPEWLRHPRSLDVVDDLERHAHVVPVLLRYRHLVLLLVPSQQRGALATTAIKDAVLK